MKILGLLPTCVCKTYNWNTEVHCICQKRYSDAGLEKFPMPNALKYFALISDENLGENAEPEAQKRLPSETNSTNTNV